jgi:hypothetical protein
VILFRETFYILLTKSWFCFWVFENETGKKEKKIFETSQTSCEFMEKVSVQFYQIYSNLKNTGEIKKIALRKTLLKTHNFPIGFSVRLSKDSSDEKQKLKKL